MKPLREVVYALVDLLKEKESSNIEKNIFNYYQKNIT